MKKKLTQERLKELLDYSPDSGVFIWKIKKARANKGDIAGSNKNKAYYQTKIDGVSYYNHRLAWLFVHGYFPENEIDHMDRDKGNNRIENLREVSHSCNVRNQGIPKNNTSGVVGVGRSKFVKEWCSRIAINKKTIKLGYFDDKYDAVKARWEAEKKYNFPNCNTTSSAYLYLQKESTCASI